MSVAVSIPVLYIGFIIIFNIKTHAFGVGKSVSHRQKMVSRNHRIMYKKYFNNKFELLVMNAAQWAITGQVKIRVLRGKRKCTVNVLWQTKHKLGYDYFYLCLLISSTHTSTKLVLMRQVLSSFIDASASVHHQLVQLHCMFCVRLHDVRYSQRMGVNFRSILLATYPRYFSTNNEHMVKRSHVETWYIGM